MTAHSSSVGSYLVVQKNNKFKLTDSIIKSFNNQTDKVLRIWDIHLKGFHVCISRGNKKIFYFTYRNSNNRKKWLKLGGFPMINTIQARKLVIQNYGKIINGIDPVAENKKNKYGETIEEVSKLFLANYCIHLKSYKLCKYTFERQINPVIGNKRLNEVTKQDVMQVRQKHILLGVDGKPAKGLSTVNKIRNLISKFYNWCIEEEIYNGINPALRIKNFPTKFRTRYLKDDEIKRFISACRTYSVKNPIPTYAILLLLITGRRKGEILNLTWDNLDLFNNTMYLPDSKVGPKSFRFSDSAKEIFKQILSLLPKANDKPISNYVFPSNDKRGNVIALNNLKRPFKNILNLAEITDFKLHDLRHTFATYAALLTKDIRSVQQCLGHSSLKMTQRYAHFTDSNQIKTYEIMSKKFLSF